MIAAQIIIHGDLEEAFAKFGSGHAFKLADKTIRLLGSQYRMYIRKNYLAGQLLGVRTGELQKSLVVGRKHGMKLVYLVGSKGVKQKDGTFSTAAVKLANIYGHPGGYTIVPKNKKVLWFVTPGGQWIFAKKVEGKERPFMSQSAAGFDWVGAVEKVEENVIGKELKRLVAAGSYIPGGLD